MERSEKIGLGVAAAGHVLLFALLSLNFVLSDDDPKLGDPTVEITIAGDPGSSEVLSDIPLPISDPEPDTVDADPFDPSPPDEMQLPEPTPAAASPPPAARRDPPLPDRTAELRREQNARDRAAAAAKARESDARREREAREKSAAAASARKQREADERRRRMAAAQAEIANAANAASSGPPAKNAGQVRGEVNVALGRQIKPFLGGCTPNGVDVRSIVTRVTLSLNRNGSLSGISGIGQSGLNDNNRPQAQPMEDCVVSAIRKASPFSGLDDEYYDVWKSHKMAFKGS